MNMKQGVTPPYRDAGLPALLRDESVPPLVLVSPQTDPPANALLIAIDVNSAFLTT
jgi:hypothetical protein